MSGERQVTLGIVEDDDDTRTYLANHLSEEDDFTLIFACARLDEALAALEQGVPDIALVDIRLPDGNGLDFVRRYRQVGDGRALMLTVLGDRTTVLLAFECGASGYLLKDTPVERIAQDIRALVAGGTPISAQAARHLLAMVQTMPPPASAVSPPEPAPALLTARELDVLTMFSRGLTYRQTAETLGMSAHTVSDHVKSIYAKMAVHSRNEAVFEAVQNGWLQL